MIRSDHYHAHPSCPRCGYDLRGSVASWQSDGDGAHCPIEGICSECGLTFAWADVLRPDRVTPEWSFEHAPVSAGIGENLSRLFRTVARLPLRHQLWSAMPLAVSVHRRRAAIVGLSGISFAYVLGGVIFVGMLSAGWLLGWWAEGFPTLNIHQRGVPFVPTLGPHLLSLCGNWFKHWYLDRSGIFPSALFECPNLVGWLWPTLIGPCFLLLPQTMRRVRVSRRHIWRTSLYGLWLVPLAGVAAGSKYFVESSFRFIITTYMSGLNPWPERLAESSGLIGLALTFLALWFWWNAVTTRYLRLPQGMLVSLALVLIGFLASMALLFAIPATRPSVMLYMRWVFIGESIWT